MSHYSKKFLSVNSINNYCIMSTSYFRATVVIQVFHDRQTLVGFYLVGGQPTLSPPFFAVVFTRFSNVRRQIAYPETSKNGCQRDFCSACARLPGLSIFRPFPLRKLRGTLIDSLKAFRLLGPSKPSDHKSRSTFAKHNTQSFVLTRIAQLYLGTYIVERSS